METLQYVQTYPITVDGCKYIQYLPCPSDVLPHRHTERLSSLLRDYIEKGRWGQSTSVREYGGSIGTLYLVMTFVDCSLQRGRAQK